MLRWGEVLRTVPELAREAQASMDVGNHKALATLREDGSPRVSAIEARFIDDDLWLASILDTPKVLDLCRDPRLALHSSSPEPDVWMGDAKIAGRAEEVSDPAIREGYADAAGTAPPGGFRLFRVLVAELVVLRLGDPPDHIVARRWVPGSDITTTVLM